MSHVPGSGIARGMALTFRRFFEPKATVRYPEVKPEIAPKNRGRLQLLYDEHGFLKCETCFQCAQACPIECIDMGGVDTRRRYHVHWGPAETYGERREEAALRRSGRPVPDAAFDGFAEVDLAAVTAALEAHDHDPAHMIEILEETQAAYGYLPVAALKHISFATGAWYAMVYGTASYYRQFRFAPAASAAPRASAASAAEAARARALADRRPSEATFLSALDAALGTGPRPASGRPASGGAEGPRA